MKVMECILVTIIKTQVDIDTMQFAFMLGQRTPDAIFIFQQVHESIWVNRDLYFVFVNLVRALARSMPRKALWWARRKLGVEKWLIITAEATYN